MRSSLLTSTALACAALFVACGAKAVPIHVGFMAAVGHHSWTSPVIGDPHGTVSLSAWEYDNGAWTDAVIAGSNLTSGAQGIGVVCNQLPTGNACGENQIGSVPWQMIDVNISQLTGWNALTFVLYSVDPSKSGYLLGASCSVGGACQGVQLTSCNNPGTTTGPVSCSFRLSRLALAGLTDIWVSPSDLDHDGDDAGNILLGGGNDDGFVLDAIEEPVPEPAVLGVFGLGLLLIGVFVGLRRRRAH